MSDKPRIVVLCGSSRFVDVMAVCAWFIERDEKAITMGLHLLPDWYGAAPDHLAEHEGIAEEMDELHLRKIDLADEIFVVDVNEYIGESTAREINYASKLGKPIRLYTEDPLQLKVLNHAHAVKVRSEYSVHWAARAENLPAARLAIKEDSAREDINEEIGV